MMRLVPDIGFEIHAQLATRTKLFCSCPNDVGGSPNTRVCPVCLGLPGALPVLNEAAIDLALRIALAFGARVAPGMRFARKNYFYPDLPKGYQITQYERPVALAGGFAGGPEGGVRIRRVHLEEDAGKTVHGSRGERSRVDMNRSGVPLVEIVTEPDVHSIEEADAFLKAVRGVLVFLGVSSGRMHEGAIRFDTNISLRREGSGSPGAKTEIKNLNSFRSVARALAYEIERQSALIESGRPVVHETLLWDETLDRATPMRSKEEKSDYRYFPDPDLGPFTLSRERLERVSRTMPELPDEARERLRSRHGLSDEQLDALAAHPEAVRCFDSALEALEVAGCDGEATTLANWMVGPVAGLAHSKGIELADLVRGALPAERLADVVAARLSGRVSEPAARKLLEAAAGSDEPVSALIARLGLERLDDAAELERVVRRVVDQHPSEARRWRDGERKLTRYFMGLIMAETKGRADPTRVKQLLEARLGGS